MKRPTMTPLVPSDAGACKLRTSKLPTGISSGPCGVGLAGLVVLKRTVPAWMPALNLRPGDRKTSVTRVLRGML